MNLKQFAEQYRLKIRCDECGDSIIPGRRGHLYFDGAALCAMWTDARPMLTKTIGALGGKVWQGDISTNAKGRRVQDAWVKGIPLENAKEAIRLVGAKTKKRVSEETLAHLAGLRQTLAGTHPLALESIAEGGVRVRAGSKAENRFDSAK